MLRPTDRTQQKTVKRGLQPRPLSGQLPQMPNRQISQYRPMQQMGGPTQGLQTGQTGSKPYMNTPMGGPAQGLQTGQTGSKPYMNTPMGGPAQRLQTGQTGSKPYMNTPMGGPAQRLQTGQTGSKPYMNTPMEGQPMGGQPVDLFRQPTGQAGPRPVGGQDQSPIKGGHQAFIREALNAGLSPNMVMQFLSKKLKLK